MNKSPHPYLTELSLPKFLSLCTMVGETDVSVTMKIKTQPYDVTQTWNIGTNVSVSNLNDLYEVSL